MNTLQMLSGLRIRLYALAPPWPRPGHALAPVLVMALAASHTK